MNAYSEPELLLLHALPFDGSMWARQMHILPNATYAPTLYSLGTTIESWAAKALKLTHGDKLIVVGCSVGGSCALEVAKLAPERVSALVLIGTKASFRPDASFLASAIKLISEEGLHAAWEKYWRPLFYKNTRPQVIAQGKQMMVRQPTGNITCGITAFHTRKSRDHTLSEFPRPIIIITGDNDTAPGLETSLRQSEMAVNGQLYIIPDCGHYVPLEQPDALNTILTKLVANI